ncbi:ISAs1 family transposase [Micromonospora sp. ATA32]|nr:ISAs1 family transposase [Micromonospora sp. ATA32]
MFTVKGNKPALLAAITSRLPAATTAASAHTDTERRSGYRVTRTIWIAPATGVDFPGAAVVFRLRRDVYAPDGQRVSKQIVHGITSLSGAAADLLTYIRTHWWIENKVHWVRDVLFGEDTHHAWLGNVAHAMASLRNLTIALIRLAGHYRIKQVMERHHADKMLIPALLNASRP